MLAKTSSLHLAQGFTAEGQKGTVFCQFGSPKIIQEYYNH